jgi:hypothetical protein
MRMASGVRIGLLGRVQDGELVLDVLLSRREASIGLGLDLGKDKTEVFKEALFF